MMLLQLLSLLALILYVVLMIIYIVLWRRVPTQAAPAPAYIPSTKISVIIPARNEAARITDCVQAILKQDYPEHLLEIIVVDDHSTDDTAAIARALNAQRIKTLSLAEFIDAGHTIGSFKKKALSAGIANSTGTLIVSTDADCTAGTQWLKQIAALYETSNPAMIVAPVCFSNNNSLVERFQAIDFMTMQGITAATIQGRLGIMCNGANLAFSRAAFDAVNGYEGVDHIVSGDDYLLMMKIRNKFSAHSIAYLKAPEAIVYTPPQPDWRSFLQQRIRWASKTGKYKDPVVTAILLLVYSFNTLLLLHVPVALCGLEPMRFLICLWLVKITAELSFLVPVARFYKKEALLWRFPLLQPLHSCYIFIAGFFGAVGKYSWKGRAAR